MFEKVYQKAFYLRPHLEAPFLKEREAFVSRLASRGFCVRYQQMVAGYLLFAVQYLGLTDNDHTPVCVKAIWEMGQAYRQMRLSSKRRKNQSADVDTKYQDQIFYTVSWLGKIGMLDSIYSAPDNILNKLMKKDYCKLKYLCAPLSDERLSYLRHLQNHGYAPTVIRETAEMQLVVVEMLNLITPRKVHTYEISSARFKWDSISRGKHLTHSGKAFKAFGSVATNWLRYAGLLEEDGKTICEEDKIEQYCHWMRDEKGLSTATISGRKRELARFTAYIHSLGKGMDTLTPSIIDGYIGHRRKDGCCRRSVAVIVTCLRGFIHYAYTCKWTAMDFSASIHAPRLFPHENIPYAPSWDEVSLLVNVYDGDDAASIRNKAIMLLLAVYGLRTGEVADLKLGDIDWLNDTMVVNHKKGGPSMLYPLYPEVGNAIVRYLKDVRQNGWGDRHVFLIMAAPYHGITRSIIYNVVANAYRIAGVSVKHKGGHSLRHACASKLVNSGKTLKTVSDVLGHRSLESTRTYAKVDLKSLSAVAEMNWEGLI